MLMGVLTLQSCTSYRLKIITSGEQKYYFPQKRTLFEWEDFDREMFVDVNSAELFIYKQMYGEDVPIVQYKKIKP